MTVVRSEVPPTVVVVDDDPAVRESLGALLTTFGYRPWLFESGTAVLTQAAQLRAECLLIDFALPDCNGIQLVAALKQAGFTAPAILMTAQEDVVASLRERPVSVSAVLAKPVGDAVLLHTIARLLPTYGVSA